MARFLATRLSLLAWLLLVASALAFAASVHWTLELLSHLAVHLAVLGIVAGLVLVALNRPLAAGAALVAAVLAGWRMLPPVGSETPGPARSGGTLSVVAWNVSSDNDAPETVFTALGDGEPDIIALFEVTPRIEALAVRALPAYRVVLAHARGDNFGILVLSRQPDVRAQAHLHPSSGAPSALVDVCAGRVLLIASHPPPPLGRSLRATRDAHLAELAALAAGAARPVMVIGDLNVTPYAPAYGRLLADGGLRSHRGPLSVSPTWAPPPLPLWMGLPIDHALADARIGFERYEIGQRAGSDHAPIAVRYRLEEPCPSGSTGS